MIEWLRWFVFGAAAIFFIGNAVTNAATVVRCIVSKKGGSMIPLFGGVAGAVGVIVSPSPSLHPLWWLPLVVDPGSLFWAGAALIMLAKGRWF